jgi:serine protease AprX
LIPPATAPHALTVGGLDDRNTFDHAALALWHSNYGHAANGIAKPELVAPSLWVAAPLLPGTAAARDAEQLFARRMNGDAGVEPDIAARKLITPHYQHAEGTSFAAPIVASAACCMLEANLALTPRLLRDALVATTHPVPGAPAERQGAGALDAGRAVARALAERHGAAVAGAQSPRVTPQGVVFSLHDHAAGKVELFGSWSNWREPVALAQAEPGAWQSPALAIPHGRHEYKFLLDSTRWLDDPANPRKFPDGLGGLNSLLRL